MAYTFKEGKMASNQLDVCLANAVAKKDGENVAIKNGSLVVLGELLADDTYNTADYTAPNAVEYDTYEATAPAAATDEVVIVDYAGIAEGVIAGNNYRMGIKLYDLEVPAGTATRVRRLHLHDKFWLGDSNFAAAPTVGKYAVATAGDYVHTAADAKPEKGYAVKVLAKEDLTAGMATKGTLYLCEVVQL